MLAAHRQYKSALTGAVKYKLRQQIETAVQQKIKFDKSVLKASYSWRSNNILYGKEANST